MGVWFRSRAACALLAMLGCGVVHADELETTLTAALTLAPAADPMDRLGRIDPMLAAYASAGLIAAKPDFRIDYDDYYVLKRPASFLGHRLAAIEVESMQKFIGCCVNEGVILLLQGEEDDALAGFADSNGCSILGYENPAFDKKQTARRFAKGDYVSLSCRLHDANER